jgi:hypothetical protein
MFLPAFILTAAGGVLCARKIAADIAAVKAIRSEVMQGRLTDYLPVPG